MNYLYSAIYIYFAIGLALATIFTLMLTYGFKRLDGKTRLQVDYMIVRFGKHWLIVGLFIALATCYPIIAYLTWKKRK